MGHFERRSVRLALLMDAEPAELFIDLTREQGEEAVELMSW
jgi:hypothetical protein